MRLGTGREAKEVNGAVVGVVVVYGVVCGVVCGVGRVHY